MRSFIYGPVPSWRLGRSLGVDMLSTQQKTCSFDCVYCQLGRTRKPQIRRGEFVSLDGLLPQLKKAKGAVADYVTFSGMGEPTLAANLGEAIALAKSILNLPVAVLTNSSLITEEAVRSDLILADVVVAKLDAPDETVFRKINHPLKGLSFTEIVKALSLFRQKYAGKLALQMMFINANRALAGDMAIISEELMPDELQLNTPLRPCGSDPLSQEELSAIQRKFSKFKNVVNVFGASRPDVKPFNLGETLRRRPKL